MGTACLILSRPLPELAFPSSALPASGFMGIISARDIKAPLTDTNMEKDGGRKKSYPQIAADLMARDLYLRPSRVF
jgi:hypothetical protein